MKDHGEGKKQVEKKCIFERSERIKEGLARNITNMNTENSRIFLFSFLRTFSIFIIFLHHFCKTTGLIKDYTFAPVLAIAILIFTSSFLSRKKLERIGPKKWLFKRFIKILLPYWILYNSLVVANLIFKFRSYDYSNYLLEMLGLQIFIKPLYEATWFITYILLLYIFVFLGYQFRYSIIAVIILSFFEVFFLSRYTYHQFITTSRLVFWQTLLVFGLFSPSSIIYFLERIYLFILPSEINMFFDKLNFVLYYFYLMHGPILSFLLEIINIGPEFGFILSLCLSYVFSFLFQKIYYFISLYLATSYFKVKNFITDKKTTSAF